MIALRSEGLEDSCQGGHFVEGKVLNANYIVNRKYASLVKKDKICLDTFDINKSLYVT